MKTFSDYAYEKLVDLFNNHSYEVGGEPKKIDPVKSVKYKEYETLARIFHQLDEF